MLARPLASDTVLARAVWRLKCSVVTQVIAGPRRSPSASTSRVWSGAALSREPVIVRQHPAGGGARQDETAIRRCPSGAAARRRGETIEMGHRLQTLVPPRDSPGGTQLGAKSAPRLPKGVASDRAQRPADSRKR